MKDLILKMIKYDPKQRLTWEELFEHPLFKSEWKNNNINWYKANTLWMTFFCMSVFIENILYLYIKNGVFFVFFESGIDGAHQKYRYVRTQSTFLWGLTDRNVVEKSIKHFYIISYYNVLNNIKLFFFVSLKQKLRLCN